MSRHTVVNLVSAECFTNNFFSGFDFPSQSCKRSYELFVLQVCIFLCWPQCLCYGYGDISRHSWYDCPFNYIAIAISLMIYMMYTPRDLIMLLLKHERSLGKIIVTINIWFHMFLVWVSRERTIFCLWGYIQKVLRNCGCISVEIMLINCSRCYFDSGGVLIVRTPAYWNYDSLFFQDMRTIQPRPKKEQNFCLVI